MQKHRTSNLRLVVASNRGPVEHHLRTDNQIEVRRASGGLVTALSAFRRHHDFSWVASAMTPGDRRIARSPKPLDNLGTTAQNSHSGTGTPDKPIFAVDFVVVPKDVFHNHYDVFSSRILWFLQHSMWDQLQAPKDKDTIGRAWCEGYVPANVAFAQAVAARVKRQQMPVVMLHDYHLYLAPGFIREQLPDALLQHFVHIPWPAPSVWRSLPISLRGKIYRGLVANNIIGFQTQACVHNFLRCCDEFLQDAEVDYVGQTVSFHNRITRVRAYPISVDVNELRNAMNSGTVKRYQERLRPLCGERTLVRVDRLEPSKNIYLGFRAFERLLDTHRELQGKVKFLAFLVPSRMAIDEYVHYRDKVMGLVQAINAKFGRDGFQPIEIFYENNYHQALAGMSLCDALLVNPLADGMNLVAKEGPIVSARDGVLVLSRMAGAFAQLQDEVLDIEPNDVDGTAKALGDALAMSQRERHERI
ncbi:MAG: trehalose-6-phosphate synthase, partial [Chloroflexi bacterium]|nr:trehalose-6-phosphate synthase [Chloroflexota bacterium]